jgi:hypothetical protein
VPRDDVEFLQALARGEVPMPEAVPSEPVATDRIRFLRDDELVGPEEQRRRNLADLVATRAQANVQERVPAPGTVAAQSVAEDFGAVPQGPLPDSALAALAVAAGRAAQRQVTRPADQAEMSKTRSVLATIFPREFQTINQIGENLSAIAEDRPPDFSTIGFSGLPTESATFQGARLLGATSALPGEFILDAPVGALESPIERTLPGPPLALQAAPAVLEALARGAEVRQEQGAPPLADVASTVGGGLTTAGQAIEDFVNPVEAATGLGLFGLPGDVLGQGVQALGSAVGGAGALADPLGGVDPTVARARAAELQDVSNETTIGEALLGATRAERGVFDDSPRHWLTRNLLAGLDKVRTGRSFVDDLIVGAEQSFGAEASFLKTASAAAGLGIEVAVPWEFPAVKTVTGGAKVARGVRAAQEAGTPLLRTVAAFASDDGVSMAKVWRAQAERQSDPARAIAQLYDSSPPTASIAREMQAVTAPPIRPAPPPPPGPKPRPRYTPHDPITGTRARIETPDAIVPARTAEELDELIAAQSLANDRTIGARVGSALGPRRPRNMDEFRDLAYDPAMEGLIKRQPSNGYYFLHHRAPNQWVTDDVYRLLDGDGQVVSTGTYEAGLRGMTRRQQPGDVLQYGQLRDVASWRRGTKNGVSDIVANRDFASPAERLIRERLVNTDPRATIAADKVADFLARARRVDDPGGIAAADELTGGRGVPPLRTIVPRTTTDAFDTAEAALEARLRGIHGTHKLVPVADGVWVTPRERGALLNRWQDTMRRAGIDPAKLVDETADGLIDIDDDTLAAIRRLANRYGAITPELGLTRSQWSDLVDRAMRIEAGMSAASRWALQDSGDLVAGVMRGLRGAVSQAAMASAHVRGVDPPAVERTMLRGLDSLLGTEDALLPKQTRVMRDSLLQSLRETARSFRNEIGEVIRQGGTVEDALATVMARRVVVGGRAQQLADAITTNPLPRAEDVWRARDAVLQETRGQVPPRLQGLQLPEPSAVKKATQDWAREQLGERDRQLADAILATIRAPRPTFDDSVARALRGLTPRQRSQAWTDWLEIQGDTPAFRALVREVDGGRQNDPAVAAGRWALLQRGHQTAKDALDELANGQLAVPMPDHMRRTLHGLVLGNSPRLPDGRLAHPVTEAEMSVLEGWMRRWGIEPSAATMHEPTEIAVGRQRMVVPGAVAAEFARAAARNRRAAANLKGGTPADALRTLLQFHKKRILGGWFIPRLEYVVMNGIGLPFIASQQIGARATAAALAENVAHNSIINGIVRNANHFGHRFAGRNVGEEVLVLPSGTMYSTDELTEMATGLGVLQSQVSVEAARRGVDELFGPDHLLQNLRRTIDSTPEMTLGLVDAMEQRFRTSVFINRLRAGDAPQEAGRLARESLFDFGSLTKSDRDYWRKMFLFWTFQRKNLDGFWRAALTNPTRVARQARLMRDQAKAWGRGQLETASVQSPDALIVWSDDDMVDSNGQLDSRVAGSTLTAPGALNVGEALLLSQELAKLPSAAISDHEEAVQFFSDKVHPSIGTLLFDATTGRDARGFPIDTDSRTLVPETIAQFPILADVFGVAPVPLRQGDNPDLQQHSIAGEPRFWRAGGDSNLTGEEARRAVLFWREWNAAVGSDTRNLLDLERLGVLPWANGQQLPWQTNAEAFAALMGFKAQVQLSDEGIRRRQVTNEILDETRGATRRASRFVP